MKTWDQIAEQVEAIAKTQFILAQCDEDEGYDYGVMIDEDGEPQEYMHQPMDGYIASIDDRVILSFGSIGNAVRDVYDLPSPKPYTEEDLQEWAEEAWVEHPLDWNETKHAYECLVGIVNCEAE